MELTCIPTTQSFLDGRLVFLGRSDRFLWSQYDRSQSLQKNWDDPQRPLNAHNDDVETKLMIVVISLLLSLLSTKHRRTSS